MGGIEKLIPELAEWNNGQGIDVAEWLGCIGRYDHAIAYSTIFWPEFFVFDDCVLRRPMDAETHNGWMAACGNDKSAVEAVVNHEHIGDLFINSEFRPNKEVVLYLGSILKDMWSCKLKQDFPEQSFEVQFLCGEPVDLVDYQLTFFQRRS